MSLTMKPTLIKVSISQDGLLPQETANLATVEFPTIPKKLLKSLGFEKVDSTTFVGVLPVFVNLGEQQEIEIELGVSTPDARKKISEMLLNISGQEVEEPKEQLPEGKKTRAKTKKVQKKSSSALETKSKKLTVVDTAAKKDSKQKKSVKTKKKS